MSSYPDNFNDKAFNKAWGDDEPEDNRNEDEVIENRKDAKKHFAEMMQSAHPDSILGCMGKLKEALDKQ